MVDEDPELDSGASPAAREGKGIVIDVVSPNVKVADIIPKPLKSAAPEFAASGQNPINTAPVVQNAPVLDGSNFHNALSSGVPVPSAQIASPRIPLMILRHLK